MILLLYFVATSSTDPFHPPSPSRRALKLSTSATRVARTERRRVHQEEAKGQDGKRVGGRNGEACESGGSRARNRGIGRHKGRKAVVGGKAPKPMGVAELKEKGDQEFKEEHFVKASVMYTRALQLDPSNLFIRGNRAMSLIRANMISKALQDCQFILDRDPGNAKALYRQALVYQRMAEVQHDDDEACRILKKAFGSASKAQNVAPSSHEVKRLVGEIWNALYPSGLQGILANRSTISQTSQGFDPNADTGPNGTYSRENHADTNQTSNYINTTIPMDEEFKEATEDNLPLILQQMVLQTVQMMVENGTNIRTQFWIYHPDEEQQFTNVLIEDCFQSAAFLQSCIQFLSREVISRKARACCTVVPLSKIRYPLIYQKSRFDRDGVVLQFDIPEMRRIFFLPEIDPMLYNNSESTDAVELDSEYELHKIGEILSLIPDSDHQLQQGESGSRIEDVDAG